jgi:hypothetical protein
MLKVLLTVVILFGSLMVVMWWASDKLINAKRVAEVLKDAYFDGGPLDGKTHKLKTLPAEYHYADAVYKHNGGGVYTFEDYLTDTDSYQAVKGWAND